MNGREKYFNTINFDELWALSGRMAQWSEAAFFRWRKLGCNGVSTSISFFSFIVFYPLASYYLFSLMTPLASRDFCENVFLVVSFA